MSSASGQDRPQDHGPEELPDVGGRPFDVAGLGERVTDGGRRFRHLPSPVPAEDQVTTTHIDPGRDPRGGRDPERDWLLRYSAG